MKRNLSLSSSQATGSSLTSPTVTVQPTAAPMQTQASASKAPFAAPMEIITTSSGAEEDNACEAQSDEDTVFEEINDKDIATSNEDSESTCSLTVEEKMLKMPSIEQKAIVNDFVEQN